MKNLLKHIRKRLKMKTQMRILISKVEMIQVMMMIVPKRELRRKKIRREIKLEILPKSEKLVTI